MFVISDREGNVLWEMIASDLWEREGFNIDT